VADYPLHRRREDPDHATQSHTDQMNALVKATRDVLAQTNVRGEDVVAMALDTTGSSVVVVDEALQPLEFMLSEFHRSNASVWVKTASTNFCGSDANVVGYPNCAAGYPSGALC
jgi:ribulose kinase